MSPKDESSKRAERKKLEKRLLRSRLGSEAMTDIAPIALGSLAMIASSLSNQAVPRLLGKLLDQKTSDRTLNTCATGGVSQSTMTSLALVVLGGGLASFVRTTMLNRAEDRIASRLRSNAFRSLLTKRDMEWFHMETFGENERENDNRPTDKKEKTLSRNAGMTPGAVENVLNEDVNQVSHSLTANVANLIRSTCSIGYSTFHMLHINPGLFGLSFSVVPLIGSAAMVLRKFIKRVATKQRETATLAASFAEERLFHIAMVKMSNRELQEVEEYTKLQEECVSLGRLVSVANGAFMGFIFAASSGALFMVFHAGGKAVAEGRMTAGDLTSFATYTFLLGLGTSGVFKALSEMMQGMDSAERVYRLIDGPSMEETTETKETPTSPVKVNVDATAVDSVSFHHVFFAYKTDPEKNVLRDVSFDLKRGQVVALVGKNGSGKTTIASLLAALYKPKSGSILLPGGVDYSSLDRKVQKQLIQVVPQNPALFNTSVLENVKYSCPEATDEQAINVLNTANCSGFVAKLDGGIHYQVGLNGEKLSGGQRQRIGLARALLSDPACLVLDEPTSSLDAEGQSAVADAVLACRGNNDDDKSPGRALLLITHRAKSLQVADIVLVIKNGEIVERGDFQELSKNKDSQLCALMPDLL